MPQEMNKPLFADNWYGQVPGDQLREEVQNLYLVGGGIASSLSQVQGALANFVLLADLQYGSNAQGQWVRLPNGLQICWGEVYLGTRVEFGNGSSLEPYRTNVEDVTFPVSFQSAPIVQLTPRVDSTAGRRRSMSISYRLKTATTIERVQATALSDTDNADDVWADWSAIGTYQI